MRSLEYVLKYALTQAVMHACCDRLEEESGDTEGNIQTCLYDEDNPTSQLWQEANAEQQQATKEWENR